ncbi:response regulator [Alteribacillus sp. HJP-4]|uniref:response regulator n=1 Tax=Alteribacillus sp. HJP-4 TaxID=2775394 RepID=UPI0035CD16FF
MIRTLIVEDDPMVSKFNRIYLEKMEGFKAVGFAEDVETARTFMQKHKVDLLLLDVYMKEETGLDFLMELRSQGSPVDAIVITAANDNYSVQTALRYGAVDYLIKPFDFERFKGALLQYREQQLLMNHADSVKQEDLDPFLYNTQKEVRTEEDLPKGLTELTLSRIAVFIEEANPNNFSAREVSEATGISQVSVRKYLHYLHKKNILNAEVIYQETGRPLHQYHVHPMQKSALRNYIL